MKRNTLIKVVLLALVAVLAFTLVSCVDGGDDTEKVAIYLDPNGGTLDGDDVIYANLGESIGKLPTPERSGYEFLGWYEDGNERWEVDRRTKVEYEMEIVALWKPLGNLVAVDFRLNADESLNDGAKMYFEIVKGQRIATVLSSLPTASKEDTDDAYYKFLGWKDENGNTVSLTTIIDKDMSLIPVWEANRFCLGGVELHDWTLFEQVSEATCTDAAIKERSCRICGWSQSEKIGEATGHDWGKVSLTIDSNDGSLNRSRKCQVCSKAEDNVLKSQSSSLLNLPEAEGRAYGLGNLGLLYDNKFNNSPVDPIQGSSLTMTITPKSGEPLYLDCLIFSGIGNAGTIEVTVTYSDGSTSLIGVGSTNTVTQFDIQAEIIKIELYQESTIGGTYWSEIAVFTE